MEYGSGYRLSPQQQRLWQWHQNDTVSVSQCAVSIDGPLSRATLKDACAQVVGRHEALRTTFYRQSGMKLPLQVVNNDLRLAWDEIDLAGADACKVQAEIEARLAAERRRPLDLQHGPLVRFVVVGLSPRRHVLLVTAAALCADARSLCNVVREIGDRIGGARGGDAESPLQYADYSEWRNELAAAEDSETGKAFWQSRDIVPSPSLPFQRKCVPGSAIEPATVKRPLPAGGWDHLRAIANKAGVPLPMVLLAGWQTLLWRLTGQTDITIDYHLDGRSQEEVRHAVGLFAQPVPVTCRIEDAPFVEVLRRVREAADAAEQWQDYCPPPAGSPTASPAIAFEYGESPPRCAVNDVTLSVFRIDSRVAPFALKLVCAGDGADLELHFDARLFGRTDVERIADHLERLLGDAGNDPKSGAGALQILSESERRRLVDELNRTTADYPHDRCIHHLFEEQVDRTPERPALACDGRQWTYRELNARANQLAHRLRSLGVKPGARVGLCMDRSGESIVALLGILKAGAAYVPLHSEQPKARLAFQLAETAAPVLVTQESLLTGLPEFAGAIVCLDRDASTLDGQPTTNPERLGTPEDLVYVIYTSGSTGTPKGVAVRHRNLVNYAHYMCGRLGAEAGLNFATVSTLSADLGNTCVFPALISGGCLHVIPYEMAMDGNRVADYAARQPIDVLKITPSHLAALLASAESGDVLPHKLLVLGGEASSWDFVRRIREFGRCGVINHYGPTETTVGSLTFDADGQDSEIASTVPVGRPIANTRVYVLDAHGQPVPIGVAGELYIAGDGVAQGYLNQPARTAERFVREPFAGGPDARMYRTGDLVRYLPDGAIEFLGRIDQQVKIRGFRVEPGEVEGVLSRHAGVRRVAVTARDDKAGGKCLVAYVVPAAGRSAPVDELRRYLLEQLPHYMVPAAFVTLEDLPLTANGKIDRQALPDPDAVPAAGKPFAAARNPDEEALCRIWSEVLGVERVGIHDDFFELGGHSLLATQVVSRVRGALGVDLPLRTIFESPTVAGLVEALTRLRGEDAEGEDVSRMLEEIEGLSEEEVQQLLEVEMGQAQT